MKNDYDIIIKKEDIQQKYVKREFNLDLDLLRLGKIFLQITMSILNAMFS
jgi:hypothetical protein